MTEVVLFDPDFFGLEQDLESENFRFNIGLLSIGSYLKHNGINTKVFYKSRYYLKELKNIITPEVKLVGISTMTAQFDNAIRLAKKIKKIRPDLPIIVGGCHVRLFSEKVLQYKEFDIVVPGGGEIPMRGIFNVLKAKKSLRSVKGLGYKQEGKSIWTGPQEDIDAKLLPRMDYSIMDHFSLVNWYDGQQSMYVYSGAGCPFNCTFCINSVNFRKFQQRKISDVVDEIEMLIKTYGITHVYPTDEFFCANKTRLLEFLDLIEKRKLHFSWFIQNRADTITPERLNLKILKKMKKLGCTTMLLGAESGSDEMLARMKKNLRTIQIIKAVKNLVAADIVPWLTFMIGMPEETREDYKATLRLIDKLKNISQKVIISGPVLYRPIPGSVMYNKAISYYSKRENLRFSLSSEFAHSNLASSLQVKQCGYKWIQDKKLVYDILLCIERFYTYPSIWSNWVNLIKSTIFILCPNIVINNISFIKERFEGVDLSNKMKYFQYYVSLYYYFICYLFPSGRRYLVSKQLNPKAFNPLLWFKWKWLLRSVGK